jgi:putative photosynthetic complex assembly protein 2
VVIEHLLPAAYALFVWWAGTGVILYLDGLPRATHPWTMLWASVLLAVALAGLVATADDTRATGAYLAFTCTIVIWAWKELAFLMGYVTGPRRIACPEGARGWARVGYALLAILWHELALLVLFAAVLALTWGAANPVAACTFATLWLMRLSAKLNVFLGVRNLNEEFLPEPVRYLGSYFRERPMNRFFPVSLIASTALALALWDHALAPTTSHFGAVSTTIVAMLTTLAVLEHALMMLPLPSQWLWRWGLKSGDRARSAAGPG